MQLICDKAVKHIVCSCCCAFNGGVYGIKHLPPYEYVVAQLGSKCYYLLRNKLYTEMQQSAETLPVQTFTTRARIEAGDGVCTPMILTASVKDAFKRAVLQHQKLKLQLSRIQRRRR